MVLVPLLALCVVLCGCTRAAVGATLCVLEPLVTRPGLPTCGGAACPGRPDALPTAPPPDTPCDAQLRYRSYDGACNNLQHPAWGQALAPALRLLPPRYNGTGVSVRLSASGRELPLPRVLSARLFPDRDRPSARHSLACMQWGQLVAHDTARSPTGAAVDCCRPPERALPHCYPVEVPRDDRFYARFNCTCISFLRTKYQWTQHGDCYTPDQLNSVSHVMDLSQVYGSSAAGAAALREGRGGRLRVSRSTAGRDFPPAGNFSPEVCFMPPPPPPGISFLAGDTRVNQNIQYAGLQVLMLREHNRVAGALSALNPHWADGTLLEQARAILVAAYQHISYGAWLPELLGDVYMRRWDLYPRNHGYTRYNSSINPASIASSIAGAFRAHHSAVQGLLALGHAQGHTQGHTQGRRCPMRALRISDWMCRPGLLERAAYLDQLMLGLTLQPMQMVDRFFTTQLTEQEFHGPSAYGEDLESFDIQRGRDHGLPTYEDVRQVCGRPAARSFTDLLDHMTQESVDLLASQYEHVGDVDLYVGGLLETAAAGAQLGPAFLCILAEQFVRKKFGDRFWYEVADQPHSFTPDQLQEIRKATLSRLLCDNGHNITHVQPNSFLLPTIPGNGIVPCSAIPAMNLSKWIDKNQEEISTTTQINS